VINISDKKTKKKKPKLCLACSAGGHLTEMKQIAKCYSKYSHFFLTFKRIDTEDLVDKEKVYFIQDPANNPIKLFKNLIQTIGVMRKEKPDVIITTGAGVAIPACYLGKLFFGSKVIYLESFARIREPSLTGKILYPVSDVFLVQWSELLEYYGEKAEFWGAII
jgi:UDP-N-acetylglucosamine:LPS N-acetylglucosamine transferase